ncbi:hypothetical protein EUTSA_v10027302mg, partial [Eutrema salsugineum]
SLLGNTENILYVCLDLYPCSRWYTLCQTLTNDTSEEKKSSGYVLAPLAIPHSPHARPSGLVAVGSNIYNIEHSSCVSILDCRSHTWSEAPCLREKVSSLSASVVDQKIDVAGRICKGPYYCKNSFEVFDTKTQIWDPDPIPCEYSFVNPRSACIDGKFYVNAGTNVVPYDSKEGRWDLDRGNMNDHMHFDCYCEIENVLYSAYYGVLRWYEYKYSYILPLDLCVDLMVQ